MQETVRGASTPFTPSSWVEFRLPAARSASASPKRVVHRNALPSPGRLLTEISPPISLEQLAVFRAKLVALK